MKIKYILKSLVSSILVLVVFSYMPQMSLAGMTGKVTHNKPGMTCTKEESYKDGSGSSKKWLWTIAAAALVAGLALAGGGSGGGGDGGNVPSGSETPTTGSISANW